MEIRLKVSLSPFYHLSGQGATKEATRKERCHDDYQQQRGNCR